MTACEHCAGADGGRRRFVAQMLLLAVSAWVAEGCGDGDIGGPAGPDTAPPISGGPLVVDVTDFPALGSVGGIARVDGGLSTPVAAVRTGAESFLAFSLVCPHAGFRPIGIQTAGFECPNHGARFDADGTWSGGQRTRNLLAYPTQFDAGTQTLTIG